MHGLRRAIVAAAAAPAPGESVSFPNAVGVGRRRRSTPVPVPVPINPFKNGHVHDSTTISSTIHENLLLPKQVLVLFSANGNIQGAEPLAFFLMLILGMSLSAVISDDH